MRKLLLVATMMMVPFAAFAKAPAMTAGGDVNLAQTSAGSTAGVSSTQGTQARTNVNGNGAVTVGTVSGNYTSVQTTAAGQAGPGGSATQTSAQQVNTGGTVSSGLGVSKSGSNGQHASGASGATQGGQSSQASGASGATASNMNLGGAASVTLPGRSGGSRY